MMLSRAIAGLFAGMVGLGLWSWTKDAREIEKSIARKVESEVAIASDGLSVGISGRDVTLSGWIGGATERKAVLDRVAGIEGLRKLSDSVEALPVVVPMTFSATKNDGMVSFAGYVPPESAFARLAGHSAHVQIAAGAPDASWGEAVELGVAALATLRNGTLHIEGRSMALSGVAGEIGTRDRLIGMRLPPDYKLELAVAESLPVVSPFVFSITRGGDGLQMDGYLPDEAARNRIAERYQSSARRVSIANGAPGEFVEALEIALPVFNALGQGTLAVRDRSVLLSGTVSNEVMLAAVAGLGAALPKGYELITRVDTAE